MTAVSAKDISLRYDKKDVVKSFSADFTQGKIISIIGPNAVSYTHLTLPTKLEV